ncbi:winged helix-turn-helix transcriptional regulator [Patescibacteria group bacterium]|nr:winged helix-turn-helix transcriptional regulator [Patescibacteria group bacterium]MBP9709868.1 winged helix-turn-helix transcriptional regulator [Patescibacteria group bacterium]
MMTRTRQTILEFVAKEGRVTAKAIIQHVGLGSTSIFRQLARLVKDQVLEKQGTPPKVFYSVAAMAPLQREYDFSDSVGRTLVQHFLKIGPDGTLRQGKRAFAKWCLARGLEPVKAAEDYAAIIKKYDAFKKDGLIDGTAKLQKTFPQVYLDQLFYLDFYSIERFGKTKLGELILYAKQSQNVPLVRQVVDEVRSYILQLLQDQKIDAVGFIPPTVKREVQFMKELESLLRLPVRTIKITKIKMPITVPQKTLTKLEDRIENARETLVVEEEGIYKNILLIDDAIGSGATMHEVARQIRHKKLCTGKLIGLGLVGSYSGFEVIHEV